MQNESDNKDYPGKYPTDRIRVRIDRDLQDLIPMYLENRRRDIEAILDAMAQQNYSSIEVAGHKMKGSGSGYGFDEITAIGRVLEQAAKNQNAATIRRAVSDLREYIRKIDIVYE
jgi:HPt (histidine-containing phosphotransfer) domain-containing protein